MLATSTIDPVDQHEERHLDQNHTFGRIIEAIVGNGYVYSSGVKAYLLGNGTLLAEYVATLSNTSINFQGPITEEQAKAAGLNCTTTTLLGYLIHYCNHNLSKRDRLSLVKIVLTKGACFDIGLCDLAEGMDVDLTELWAAAKQVNLKQVQLSISTIYFDSKATRDAMEVVVLYYVYCHRPIEVIFPDALYDQYVSIFIKAIEKRLSAAKAELLKKRSSTILSTDLTQSCLPDAILKSAEATKAVKELEVAINKLQYALGAAKIKIAADGLISSEQELMTLLMMKEVVCLQITTKSLEVKQAILELERDDKNSKVLLQAVDHMTNCFSVKWSQNKDADSTVRAQDAIAILEKHKEAQALLEKILKKREEIVKLEAWPDQQAEKLNGFNKSITDAEVHAKACADTYNSCVKAQADVNPLGKYVYSTVGDHVLYGTSSSFMAFLCKNSIPMQQRGVLLFQAITMGKWDCIHPLLSAGINLEGLKNKDHETVIVCLAFNYKKEMAPALMLALAHLNLDALKSIQNNKISSHCTIDCVNSVAFKYLREEKPDTKSRTL